MMSLHCEGPSHHRISRSLGLNLSLTTPTASSLGDLRLRVQTLGQSSRIYTAYRAGFGICIQGMPAIAPETSHLHERRTCMHCCTA